MHFLVDTNLPVALARFLAANGHSAQHVLDLDMGRAKDRSIWDHAAETGAVIVSKDEDFAVLRLQRDHGPQLVWVRYGNVRNKYLLARIGAALPAIVSALSAGEPMLELT